MLKMEKRDFHFSVFYRMCYFACRDLITCENRKNRQRRRVWIELSVLEEWSCVSVHTRQIQSLTYRSTTVRAYIPVTNIQIYHCQSLHTSVHHNRLNRLPPIRRCLTYQCITLTNQEMSYNRLPPIRRCLTIDSHLSGDVLHTSASQ